MRGMKYFESVLDLVGRTPLVKLQRLVNDDMADVYVKMEHLNPTGSVKDRMAVNMIRRAEAAGLIKPGATIVESTSGNTGLGLAMICAVRGYRCVCTMPDKMSQEKIDMLKAYGAEVVVTRTDLPHDHPLSYVEAEPGEGGGVSPAETGVAAPSPCPSWPPPSRP